MWSSSSRNKGAASISTVTSTTSTMQALLSKDLLTWLIVFGGLMTFTFFFFQVKSVYGDSRRHQKKLRKALSRSIAATVADLHATDSTAGDQKGQKQQPIDKLHLITEEEVEDRDKDDDDDDKSSSDNDDGSRSDSRISNEQIDEENFEEREDDEIEGNESLKDEEWFGDYPTRDSNKTSSAGNEENRNHHSDSSSSSEWSSVKSSLDCDISAMFEEEEERFDDGEYSPV